MDGIENIVARIENDSHNEIEAIQAENNAKIETMMNDFSAKAEKEAAAILNQGREQADRKEERLVSAARLENRKDLLQVKQNLVDEAFNRALEKLHTLPDDEYIALLANLAVKASVTQHEQVLFNIKDRARCGKAVVQKANLLLGGGALTMAEDTRDIDGGLVLKNGKIETNCSFKTLLQVNRDQYVSDVVSILFG